MSPSAVRIELLSSDSGTIVVAKMTMKRTMIRIQELVTGGAEILVEGKSAAVERTIPPMMIMARRRVQPRLNRRQPAGRNQ